MDGGQPGHGDQVEASEDGRDARPAGSGHPGQGQVDRPAREGGGHRNQRQLIPRVPARTPARQQHEQDDREQPPVKDAPESRPRRDDEAGEHRDRDERREPRDRHLAGGVRVGAEVPELQSTFAEHVMGGVGDADSMGMEVPREREPEGHRRPAPQCGQP